MTKIRVLERGGKNSAATAWRWCLGLVVGCALAAFAVQCGARTPLLVPDNAQSLDAGHDVRDVQVSDAPFVFLCDDASARDGGPCANLECQIATCDAGTHTTVSGVVLDPAGVRPVYDVLVYVPNGPLQPISSGTTCSACEAPASGSPIVSTVTNADGAFTLTDPPAGTDIPLVIQLGKWRRRITIPSVQRCAPNVLADRTLTRLPKKQAEGDIPRIAFTTGCDWAECFSTRTIGIDPSELTAPAGSGRVHVYQGEDGHAPIASPGDAYALYGSYQALRQYDLVLSACECSPVDRTRGKYPQAYANMKQYIDEGGRFFGTHYHYNWFAPPTGPADYQAQAPWLASNSNAQAGFLIDTSFPRGKAFADWAQGAGVTTTYARLDLTDNRNDVGGLNGGLPGNGNYTNTTQWIFHPENQTLYLSFNAPTNQPPTRQCGRAVFSDVHLSGDRQAVGGGFPAYCAGVDDHEKNEAALEFLFFDLSSCVQDDSQPPAQPCNK